MKKSIYILLALLSLVGCKKEKTASVEGFEITVSRIEAHKVWLDIIPNDEYISYYLDTIGANRWVSDEAYINYLKSLTTEELRYNIRQGAFFDAVPVAPQKDYYVLITAMSGLTPVSVRKVPFSSAAQKMTSFTLSANDISMTSDGIITVSPTDTSSTYFWDFTLKTEINNEWYGLHSVWFYYNMIYFYQMDFFPSMLSKGQNQENLYDYYWDSMILDEDTICLLAVGYEVVSGDTKVPSPGETSPAYIPFWITNLKTAPTVVEAEQDGFEDWYMVMSTSSPKRNTAKASKWSPSCHPMSSFGRTGKYIPQHIRSAKR